MIKGTGLDVMNSTKKQKDGGTLPNGRTILIGDARVRMLGKVRIRR
jgi:hypothetical protein